MSRAELRALAETVLREQLGATAVGRLCPQCGSGQHGRPYARLSDGSRTAVSLSYAEGLVAVAWSRTGPVGIDVEDDGPPVGGVARTDFSRAEALSKAGAEVTAAPLQLPGGYVGWRAGADVSWRLAGPAAPPA